MNRSYQSGCEKSAGGFLLKRSRPLDNRPILFRRSRPDQRKETQLGSAASESRSVGTEPVENREACPCLHLLCFQLCHSSSPCRSTLMVAIRVCSLRKQCIPEQSRPCVSSRSYSLPDAGTH